MQHVETMLRNYDKNLIIKEQYKNMRQYQTLNYAKKMKEENLHRLKTNGTIMNIIDAVKLLNTFVDKSDPDMNLPNMHHLFQTAEGMRKDNLDDWFQLVGLLHDMGKIMFLWGNDANGTSLNTQWGIVGDTYILGCRLRNTYTCPEFDQLCPDMSNSELNSEMGIYLPNCGINNCIFTWSHDEYLYDVLRYNQDIGNIDSLPDIAYYIIRYHSLYPWHTYGEYQQFECNDDIMIKKYVQLFNKYDLYTKTDEKLDTDNLFDYYTKLIYKYFPNGYLVF